MKTPWLLAVFLATPQIAQALSFDVNLDPGEEEVEVTVKLKKSKDAYTATETKAETSAPKDSAPAKSQDRLSPELEPEPEPEPEGERASQGKQNAPAKNQDRLMPEHEKPAPLEAVPVVPVERKPLAPIEKKPAPQAPAKQGSAVIEESAKAAGEVAAPVDSASRTAPEKSAEPTAGNDYDEEAARKRGEELQNQARALFKPLVKADPGEPFVEKTPADLQTQVEQKVRPKFLRVNVDGYNVRTSPQFSLSRTDNLDFKTKKGDLFEVAGDPVPMKLGAAVPIFVRGEQRWVYVPYGRKAAFDVCNSEACLTNDLQEVVDFFGGDQARPNPCPPTGVPPSPPLGEAAHEVEPDPVPAPTKLKVTPLWELKYKGARGKQMTEMMLASLDKFGKKLLNQKTINDAKIFCPRYASLSNADRKEFWVHLFNGIAQNESRFEFGPPIYLEPKKDKNGRIIEEGRNIASGPIDPVRFSMGLFQLSYDSSRGKLYQPGCAGINWKKDQRKRVEDPTLTIYNPKIQMDCAVTIMNQWVGQDGGVGYTEDVWDPRLKQGKGDYRFKGGAYFWSTLRNTNGATQNVRASLKQFTPCFGKK